MVGPGMFGLFSLFSSFLFSFFRSFSLFLFWEFVTKKPSLLQMFSVCSSFSLLLLFIFYVCCSSSSCFSCSNFPFFHHLAHHVVSFSELLSFTSSALLFFGSPTNILFFNTLGPSVATSFGGFSTDEEHTRKAQNHIKTENSLGLFSGYVCLLDPRY